MTKVKLVKDPLNLVISGVGGQGNIVISTLIGNALVNEGYFVTIGETFGASQRGGAVMSQIKISEREQYSPLIAEGSGDILLGMEPVETLRALHQFGHPDIITVVNPRPIHPLSVLSGEAEYPDIVKLIENIKSLSGKTWVVAATEEALKLGNPRFANVLLIGAIVSLGILPLSRQSIELILKDTFPGFFKANVKAFQRGIELMAM